MKLLDAAATDALLDLDDLVAALAQAMRDRRQGAIHAPQRTVLPLPDDGAYLAMAACDAELAIAKLVCVTPANRERDLPILHGTVFVADARTGVAIAALDGPALTARRTAALTLLGVESLLRRPPRRVVLVGTGVQARAHAKAVQARWAPERLHAVGRSAASAQAFAEALARDGVAVEPAELAPALRDADVVVCLTTARSPVLPDDVAPATLVVGVGAFTPAMAEIPPALVRRRRVVVDDALGARDEAGDLLQAGVDWDAASEIGDWLDAAPEAPDGIVLKTVGHATWDLAAARVAAARLRA